MPAPTKRIMTVTQKGRRLITTLTLSALGVAALFYGTCDAPLAPRRKPSDTQGRRDADHDRTSPPPAPASRAERSTTQRTLVEPTAAPSELGAASFTQIVDRLCALSRRTASLARDDEIEAAQRLDREAHALMEDALSRFPDAGERALGMVVEVPDASDDGAREAGDNIRLGVLHVMLAAEFARRQETAEKHRERSRLDALTHAVLDVMPIGANTAEMGDRLLYRRPYLQPEHEPMVVALLRLAAEGAFPRKIATRVLLTLWENLRTSGARSSDELSRLALVMMDDSDPSRVVTACRQLLSDARYRDLVLAWLRGRRDHLLAGEIAQLASRELPPIDAVSVIKELSSMLDHTRDTFLAVGARAPDVVADAYRQQLAAGTHPKLRRELVMGVGLLPGGRGAEIARLALEHDPAVEVRIQAMFAITVQGDARAAESAIERLLDDPVVASNPAHLEAVVLALQNLEHDDVNVLARLSARLQSMALSPSGRRSLESLVARSLPPTGR